MNEEANLVQQVPARAILQIHKQYFLKSGVIPLKACSTKLHSWSILYIVIAISPHIYH